MWKYFGLWRKDSASHLLLLWLIVSNGHVTLNHIENVTWQTLWYIVKYRIAVRRIDKTLAREQNESRVWMWHHKSPTTLKVQAQNWTTKLAKVVQRSKPVLDVCVCFCMNWLEWESRQVSERWTFVRGRPAAHYLFMLMYLTSQLIAAGAGAQLPTASCSRTVSHSQEAGGWITYLPWLTPCVLFTFAHLKLNSKQTASVSVYRGCLLAGARERKRQKCWEREGNLFTGAWQVFGFVAVSMTDKGKVFILLFVSLVVSCVCVCVCVYHKHTLFPPLLQWTAVRMWTRALWQRRSSHHRIRINGPTSPSHSFLLFLVFIHPYPHRVRHNSEALNISSHTEED